MRLFPCNSKCGYNETKTVILSVSLSQYTKHFQRHCLRQTPTLTEMHRKDVYNVLCRTYDRVG